MRSGLWGTLVISMLIAGRTFGQMAPIGAGIGKCYQSVKDIYQAMPAALQPHKVGFFDKTNPLLAEQLEQWLRENVIGQQMVLKKRELRRFSKQTEVFSTYWSICLGEQAFMLGNVQYEPRTVECLLDVTVETAARYKMLQNEKKFPPTLSYEQYRTQQEQRSQRLKSALGRLKVLEEENGRVKSPGSKVSVVGRIVSVKTSGTMLNQKPPTVHLFVTLDHIEFQ